MTVKPASKMLLNLSDLCRCLGIGRTALYKLLHTEQLPKSVFLNGRRYWLLRDILDWLEDLKRKNY